MLYIKNREKLKRQTLSYKDVEYFVEGVYEYPTQYHIHLRSFDKTYIDETIVLERNKDLMAFKRYKIYDSNNPHRSLFITYDSIMSKGVFMCAIESMLNT